MTDPLALVTARPRASFLLAIPDNTALAGISLSTQGAAITAKGGLLMANALDIRVGDFRRSARQGVAGFFETRVTNPRALGMGERAGHVDPLQPARSDRPRQREAASRCECLS